MLSLVKYIRAGNFSGRLFPHLSLDTLCITIYDPAEIGKETLCIRFDQHNREWQFKYLSKPFAPVEMKKSYNENLGIAKFCQYIDWLKW